jgi:serine/threonine protein kinase/tetratricopeptide (TPR) repeat protein
MAIEFERVKAVFHATVDGHTPEEWDRYLDSACGGDTDLRGEVSALLRAHQDGGSLLDGRALPAGGDQTTPIVVSERPGTVIGPYKLLEQLGQGGMGVVFLAEQTQPVRRRVALKIIKPGMDTRQVIARFEAERQALALMDHPNIARVFDAGSTDTGRPYFVMELVKGVPITKYCDERQLSIRARLELLFTVCRAVQHAHQKGVIHRDLKPSNVLVAEFDGRPVPKIIDFGLAKATGQQLTERTAFTHHDQIVGTFEYMSPEQARFNQLDIDTRTDIYSLGVLLYELLTGETPFDRMRLRTAAFDEMLRIIRDEDPPTPSTRLLGTSDALQSIAANRHTVPDRLSRQIRGELDWIVMKCLEKDRNRRYTTVHGLAGDIQRYLADEPVEAIPPSAAYRLRKFARRNKTLLATAAAIALVLIAGTTVSTWQAVRATRAQHLADKRLVDLENANAATLIALDDTRRAKAQTDEALANAERERKLAEAVSSYVVNVFASPDPELDGRDVKVVDLLERSANELNNEFAGSPHTKGKLLENLGTTYAKLGMPEQAVPLFEKAREVLQTAVGPDHLDTLSCMSNLGASYRLTGRMEEAIPLLEETLRLMRAKVGATDPVAMLCLANLADAYRDAGLLAKAVPASEETLKLRRAELGPDHHETLLSMSNLGLTYFADGRHKEGLSLFEQTLKRRIAVSGHDHPATIMCINNLAGAYRSLGQLKKAIAMAEESLALTEAKLGPDHLNTIVCMNNLASFYADDSRLNDAIPLMEKTLEIKRAKLGKDNPSTLLSMGNLGWTYRAVGRTDEALSLLEEAYQVKRKKLGPGHQSTIISANNFALVLADTDRLAEAATLLEETLQLAREWLRPDHPDTLLTASNLADMYREMRQLAKSIALTEETLEVQRTTLGSDNPDTLRSMNNLVGAYLEGGRVADALPLAEETLKRRTAILGPEHRDTLGSMNNLAGCYELQGSHAEAEELLLKLISTRKEGDGAKSVEVAGWMRRLGVNMLKQQKFVDSEPYLREALAIGEEKLPDDWTTFHARNLLGGSLAGQKKYDQAESLLASGYEGMEAREAKIPPLDKGYLLDAFDRLVDFYDATGKADEAAKWRKTRDELKPDAPEPSRQDPPNESDDA